MIDLSTYNTFKKEIKEIATGASPTNLKPFNSLPLLLRNHLLLCGFNRSTAYSTASIIWSTAMMKFSPHKSWKTILCEQQNGLSEPARFAYMRTSFAGIIPVEARDKYFRGKGNLLVKVLKYFTVTDAKGLEINSSELLTILAETLIIPAYAYQRYIEWETAGERSLKATIVYAGITASGTFYFNQSGLMERFETDDRFYEERGNYKKMKWIAKVMGYEHSNGVASPKSFMATWITPNGPFDYFKGEIASVKLKI